MKAIIKRNLDLTVKYTVIDKKYIPLENSFGCTCDNCGKIIANIATVKNETGNIYNIGFDCLETILINNSLLSCNDIAEYNRIKSIIPKVLRFSKSIKEKILNNKHINITGLLFELQSYESDFYTFYWLTNNQPTSRDNDYVKIKGNDFDFMLKTLQNVFPALQILIK